MSNNADDNRERESEQDDNERGRGDDAAARENEHENGGRGKEQASKNKGDRYTLAVPLDASNLEQLRAEKSQDLKVVGRSPDGTEVTETVNLEEGTAVATLEFDGKPDGVGVYVGPDRATAEELQKSQTISLNVPGEWWVETPALELDPIEIPPYYWDWWHRWCREFVIRGRLLCPDGNPVPGAEVCAKDVDGWFFWSSTDQVGCATTDQNGTFEISFRWCCGFWPWWWWETRAWRPDPLLIDEVRSAIEAEPELSLARTEIQPNLDVFADIIEDQPLVVDEPLRELGPDRLELIRDQLVERLPATPELERLNVWPWVPWQPWWDCTPDIIFEATQAGNVVLDEDIGDTRWNIDAEESVVLTANDDARCIPPECESPPCPGGECLFVTAVCGRDLDRVGGNLGAPATPEGYLNPGTGTPSPGASSRWRDRPFAETVRLKRSSPPVQNVDYFEFEYDDGSGWDPVPRDGVQNFKIGYIHYDPTKPVGSRWDYPDAAFNFTEIDDHWVVESREHYEETNPPVWPSEPGSTDAWWGGHRDLLVAIDSTAFNDGTYRFRVVGWEETGSGDGLTNRRVLKRCPEEEDEPVEVVLTFDNRLNPDPAHPTSPTHPAGAGTVHKPVTEPDTDIVSVKVDDVEVDPCDLAEEQDGQLAVEFLAHDPDGHLSHYTLHATYGENQKRNLLTQPSSSVAPASGASPPYPGPDYGGALSQGATRPHWEGGQYVLTVDLEEAFPIECCYQLELRAWKRPIVSCGSRHHYWNISEYMIGYGV